MDHFEADFMPHGHCYFWKPDILWTHVIGDGIVTLSYFIIPILLILFVRKRNDVQFKGIFVLFAAFIWFCGTTHLFGIITVWDPIYRIEGIIKVLTGLVSFGTAIALYRIMPDALTIPNPKDLANAKRQFEQLLEAAPDGIVTINEEGSITLINKQTEKLFGYERIGLIGNKIDRLIPAWHEHFGDNNKKNKKGPIKNMQLNAVNNQGKEFPAEVSLSPVETGEGTTLTIVIIRDITERIKTEKDLLERTHELTLTNKQLENYAYITAHDMNSPLISLSGLLDILDKKDAVQEKYTDVLSRAQDSVKQMQIKVDGMNNYLKLRKQLDSKPGLIDFNTLTREVKNGISELIEQAGASIITDFDKCPQMLFPQVQMKSIFQNMITNAIRFSRAGVKPELKISTSKNEKNVILKFEDNGRGIDMEKYGAKLFGLFNRFHPDTEGTGIGLHSVSTIVEFYHGDIEVESKVGSGTTFIIKLPNEAV